MIPHPAFKYRYNVALDIPKLLQISVTDKDFDAKSLILPDPKAIADLPADYPRSDEFGP